MNIKKFFLFAGLLATMSVTSCSEYLENDAASSSQTLKIKVTDSNLNGNNTTRTAYAGFSATFETGDQIGVYVVKGTTALFSNVCFTYDATEDEWTAATTVEYNDGYSYYAYYPYTATPYTPDFTQATVDAKFDNFINDASNKFHYADQSGTTGGKSNYTLSDLMIAQGSDTGSNTVSFTMLHKKGLAVFDGDGALEATFTGNIPYTLSTKRYFLMKPSTSTSFTDDDGTYSLSASSGKYVTHNIADSYNTYILTVTGPAAYTYAGGTNSYSITSYKQNSAGTKSKAAAWTATYSTDGGSSFSSTKPSWLTTFTASGDGSTTASNYTATVSAQSAMTPSSVTASSILSSATAVGTSSDYYDLSTNGGASSMTTANCYMVHAPGYYKLPLVYGNAIKNGTVNTTAFYPNVSSSALARFINHAGTGITGPWINKSGSGVDAGMNITVNGAQLIWQDVNGLTSNYAIDGDYLKFQVPAGSIAEGNAVIAVKSGSTIVWSWHIWVTPETYSSLTSVNTKTGSGNFTNGHTYQVAPVNLGWVGSGTITKSVYEGRSCIVKISQTGGQEQTFTVTQAENITVTSSKDGNGPYYQWGRKDPFVPSVNVSGASNTNKTVYVGSGVPAAGYVYEASTSATIGTNIQNPWKHYYNSSTYGPVSTTYYNMWDAQNTTTGNVMTATKKTIYDPCPPGFCVPTGNLYYYMGNAGNRSDSNWDSSNKGKTWTSNTPNIYFPASGYRDFGSGSLSNVGSYGYYWSASPYSSNYGHYLYFYSRYWYWFNSFYRANGFPVRPVAEE